MNPCQDCDIIIPFDNYTLVYTYIKKVTLCFVYGWMGSGYICTLANELYSRFQAITRFMTQWKIAFMVGITLFSMGLPLLIIGFISTGEDKLAMLIPGAVMFGIGAFVTVVAAAIGMGFGKRVTTSEQDPASKNWWEVQSE